MSNHRNFDLTGDLAGVTDIFKALANTNRLKIFLRLADCCTPNPKQWDADSLNGCCVGDLGVDANIAPSTLSHHLKELKQSGLIQLERRGQNVHCRVNQKAALAVGSFLNAIGSATNLDK